MKKIDEISKITIEEITAELNAIGDMAKEARNENVVSKPNFSIHESVSKRPEVTEKSYDEQNFDENYGRNERNYKTSENEFTNANYSNSTQNLKNRENLANFENTNANYENSTQNFTNSPSQQNVLNEKFSTSNQNNAYENSAKNFVQNQANSQNNVSQTASNLTQSTALQSEKINPSEEKIESINSEKVFLTNLKERVEVLFEGLNEIPKDKLEERLGLTLKFLEFVLARVENRLENLEK